MKILKKQLKIFNIGSDSMKLFFADNNAAVDELNLWLDSQHQITNAINEAGTCDFIICWGITQMEKAKLIHQTNPHVPLINFNWDIYEWVWTKPRENEYDYKAYGEFLKESLEVWCPSQCTVNRMKQWFGIDGKVILSSAPYYDMPVTDEGFILMPLREIPDPQWGWFEKACTELGLPYKSTQHKLSTEEYRNTVAKCSFICSPLYELSTGGLTCLEGYYLGKPVLMCGSKWHGGKDYFGKRAKYFKTYSELKFQLLDMWKNRSVPKDHKEWVVKNFSGRAMGDRINRRLYALRRSLHQVPAAV